MTPEQRKAIKNVLSKQFQREQLRRVIRIKLKNKNRYKKYHTPKPRYDEVYFKGVEWLDSL